MLTTVNLIIHVAWRLDFNLGVTAFESSIRDTRALVNFARAAQHRDTVRLLFTCSVASARSWDPLRQGPVPEELIEDPSVSVHGGGYGQGKYVAERVLAASGIAFSSVRVGQISGGPPRGAWATTDWFPILVKTSVALGALPGSEQVGLIRTNERMSYMLTRCRRTSLGSPWTLLRGPFSTRHSPRLPSRHRTTPSTRVRSHGPR